MTAPLCAMWQGRCGNPAKMVVVTEVHIVHDWYLLSWLVCDDLCCLDAAQKHADAFDLRLIETRELSLLNAGDLSRLAVVA